MLAACCLLLKDSTARVSICSAPFIIGITMQTTVFIIAEKTADCKQYSVQGGTRDFVQGGTRDAAPLLYTVPGDKAIPILHIRFKKSLLRDLSFVPPLLEGPPRQRKQGVKSCCHQQDADEVPVHKEAGRTDPFQ